MKKKLVLKKRIKQDLLDVFFIATGLLIIYLFILVF